MSRSALLKDKDQQTAYERWELASFSDGQSQLPKKREAAAVPEMRQQLSQLTEAARKEGYAKGLGEGYAAGMQQAAQAVQADRQALVMLAQTLDQSLQKSEQQVAEQLLQLAMSLARTMLKTHFAVDETAVLPVVADAVRALPYVQQPARIHVHPLDAAAVKQYVAETQEERWHIVEDAGIARGGCRLETGANQVDAGNATRWKKIAEALGQSADWEAA